jgi:death-on-curing protein
VTAAGDPVDLLTLEDLLEIARGVLDVVEMRDMGLLASAAGRPQTTVFGPDIARAIAEHLR